MSNLYRTILADPPWKSSERFSASAGRAHKHYPYMSIEELCALPVCNLAHADSTLLLWATWPQLLNASRVMLAWGFAYVTGFPWVKILRPPVVDLSGELIARPVYGTGAWARGCSEALLIGVRGRVTPPRNNFLGLLAARLKHSRKPADVYEYAETLPAPRLELFARTRRLGWHVWGNQVECDVSLPNVT